MAHVISIGWTEKLDREGAALVTYGEGKWTVCMVYCGNRNTPYKQSIHADNPIM
ncbi:hypothetical protein KDAU_13810 [Dictyobacter aurantiacus]|uniref:Uncharacterized protein n=1 Tax=Dictyobacter aurantiacus TaxID=1936993 RepID=A0A401ZB31_9CHLR|nr:hypothetical protein KDAU_13810 [Dictyobacter aurantiacus]